MIDKRVLYEAAAKKMSATDVVIYSDKTPKSLYEYYFYKYKEEDNVIASKKLFDACKVTYKRLDIKKDKKITIELEETD